MPGEKLSVQVYLQHKTELIKYAHKLLGCPYRAEDVVQEAFIKFDKASNNIVFQKPTAYLFRIVKNLAIDSLRIRKLENALICYDTDSDDVADLISSPEHIAHYKNALEVVQEALDELPKRMSDAVIMHRIHGLKLKEIAVALGISIGLAHSLVSDGTEHCQKRLEEKIL